MPQSLRLVLRRTWSRLGRLTNDRAQRNAADALVQDRRRADDRRAALEAVARPPGRG